MDRIFTSCGGWIRTNDLEIMSLTSYHCSTPRAHYTSLFCQKPPFGIILAMSEFETPLPVEYQDVEEVNLKELKKGDILVVSVGKPGENYVIKVVGLRKEGLRVRVTQILGRTEAEYSALLSGGRFSPPNPPGPYDWKFEDTPGKLETSSEKGTGGLEFKKVRYTKNIDQRKIGPLFPSVTTQPISRIQAKKK